jgi:hypothetical protein
MPSFMEPESSLIAGLQLPSAEAHARVKEVMEKITAQEGREVGGVYEGRVYPKAWALLKQYMPTVAGVDKQVLLQRLAKVRGSVPVPQKQEAPGLDALGSLAETALVGSTSDGAYIEFVFRDEVFENVKCKVYLTEAGTVAEFTVHDDNHRRLFESEASRLRVSLEQRGLKHVSVRVVHEKVSGG